MVQLLPRKGALQSLHVYTSKHLLYYQMSQLDKIFITLLSHSAVPQFNVTLYLYFSRQVVYEIILES